MAKIVLDVENKDKETVLMILKNLKHGLIKNINVDNKNINTNSSIKKTIQKQKPLEDEFLPKAVNTGSRYLSKEEFKAKINKSKG